jgi:hypothetical protein
MPHLPEQLSASIARENVAEKNYTAPKDYIASFAILVRFAVQTALLPLVCSLDCL